MNTTATNPEATTAANPEATTAANPEANTHTQPLSRPVQDRMLAGVAAGLARYLGVDVTLVRIIFAVLAVVGGAGVPIYAACWLLIPEEGAEQSIAAGFIGSRRARSQ